MQMGPEAPYTVHFHGLGQILPVYLAVRSTSARMRTLNKQAYAHRTQARFF